MTVEERSKALKAAIDKIEKSYGKGTIVRVGDKSLEPVKTISSGSIGLDLALGGGYKIGGMVEIYGPESSGKCLNSEAYIYTPNGWKTISEIFIENDVPIFITDREVEKEVELINKNGEKELTSHFVYNGKRKFWEIGTYTGFKFKRTFKHPILTLSKNGNLIWKWSGQLEIGDYIATKKDCYYFGDSRVDLDTCYSIGLLLSDGSFGQGADLNISNNDPCIKEFIETRMIKSLGLGKFRKYKNESIEGTSFNYSLNLNENPKDLDRTKNFDNCFYDKFGLKRGYAKDKNFPKWVRELDKESMSSVIRGYMDCECYINKTGLEVTSASHTLLYQLKLMLSQYGITSIIKETIVKGYEHNQYWTLYLYGKDLLDYITEIGTESKYRTKQISKFLLERSKVKQVQTNYKHIPFIGETVKDLYYSQEVRLNSFRDIVEDIMGNSCEVTHTRLEKILQNSEECELKDKLQNLLNYTYDRVTSNEEVGEELALDFAMKETHTFIADGFINHNTTLASHAIAEVQKNGGTAAFIDAEHAYDFFYAAKLGVDTDNLLFSQPSNGEEALEVANTLINSGAVDIIIIDSVAALTPKAEIDGEVGDAQMGKQARMMGQACRKLVAATSKNNVTLIFLNQLRDKLGVMFGSPETTTGGNALKFYASQRLDIRRNAQIKGTEKDAEVEGSKVKVKVVKNKIAPPFRIAEFDIIFGEGISKVGEIIDIGVEREIIQKNGAFYSYEGTKIGHGRDATKQLLLDNPELSDEIEKKIRDGNL